MTNTDCPDRETLLQLLQGRLSGTRAELLESHLLACDECAREAEQAHVADELSDALRSSRPFANDDEMLIRAIDAGKQLRSDVETVQSEETLLAQPNAASSPIANSSSAAAANTSDSAFDEERFEYLAPAEQPDELGRLGGYRILEVLGVGGMGVVFRAEDTNLQRSIALKVMKPSVAASPSARDRFLREARAAAAIDHDHIVTIHQVGEDRGVPFIAMQYLRGESLQTLMDREGRLPDRKVARIGQQVATGLAAAHAAGVIHRDIKPDNIWIDAGSGRARILDFGLVRSVSDDGGLTQSGMILGTPRYMSPEQAQGGVVDHRCDLFSLGSVLYQLLSGQAPFDGGNLTAILMAVAHQEPTPMAVLCTGGHPELLRLIESLLQKSVDQRPQTAEEVAERLRQIALQIELQEATELAAQSTVVADRSLPASSDVELPRIVVSEATVNTRGRKRPVAWGWGLAGLVVLAGVFTVVTARGTLQVKVDGKLGDTVEVRILKNGEEVDVLDKSNQWTIRSRSGEYSVELRGGPDELRLRKNQLTVSRFGTTYVELEFDPTRKAVAADSDTSPAARPRPVQAPFSAEQAAEFQQAWADYLRQPTRTTNSIGMSLRLIPPGEFQMGSTAQERDEYLKEPPESGIGDYSYSSRVSSESPQHPVFISKPWYFGECEVTQAQYEKIMGTNPSRFSRNGDGRSKVPGVDTGTLPVETVSWLDALRFCNRLSELEGFEPCYEFEGDEVRWKPTDGYRLPTEAEWEFAARAGSTGRYYFGEDPEKLDAHAWYAGNSLNVTHSVGQKSLNAFGLFDVYGNVWEWTYETMDHEFYRESPVIDPISPERPGEMRAVRGSSFDFDWRQARSGTRGSWTPQKPIQFIGFRVARTILMDDEQLMADRAELALADRVNHALAFDGKDDYVELPFQYDGSTPLTIECYVLLETDRHIAVVSDLDFPRGLALSNFSNRFTWGSGMLEPGNDQGLVHGAVADSVSVIQRQWTHLAATIDQQQIALFVNGRRVGTTKAKAAATSGLPMWIGAVPLSEQRSQQGLPPQNALQGLVDELRISDFVRYDSGFVPERQLTPDDHTLALYHFDEASGEVLRDSSKHARHGQIHGARWVRVPFDLLQQTRRDQEHQLARWVLDQGGWIRVYDSGDRPEIRQLSDLPSTDEPLRLHTIELGGVEKISDTDVSYVASQLPRRELYSLSLYGTGITDQGVRNLRGLKVGQLFLGNTQVTDESVRVLSESMPDLGHLQLAETGITDGALQHLPRFQKLNELVLSGTQVTGAEFEQLLKVPTLTFLSAGHLPLNDEAISTLAKHPALGSLQIRFTNITDQGLKALAGSRIQRLELGPHPEITDVGLKSLATSGSLRYLSLSDCRSISDAGIQSLSELAELETLHLKGTPATDRWIEALSQIKSLKQLDLRATDVTVDGVERLRQALPECEIQTEQGVLPPLKPAAEELP